MPTYEYACDNCGHTFEAEQRIVADPLKVCPACNQASLRRLITQGNFILKGSGWYSDLYSGPSNKGKANQSKPSAEANTPSPAQSGSASPSSASSEGSKAASTAKTESAATPKASTVSAKP